MSEALKDGLSQVAITLFSISALLLAYHPDFEVRKWSPVLGILGQPFWMYVAVKRKLWGVILSNCCFIASFLYGIYILWIAQ